MDEIHPLSELRFSVFQGLAGLIWIKGFTVLPGFVILNSYIHQHNQIRIYLSSLLILNFYKSLNPNSVLKIL